MYLQSIKYNEYNNQPNEWILNKSSFERIALLVGKNASGKTRTLNVIAGLSGLLTSSTSFSSGTYEVEFSNEKNNYVYEISMLNKIITSEKFSNNDDVLLERDHLGEGKIYTKQVDDYLKFKVPKNKLAVVIKRDSEQHEFLEPLHFWASNTFHHRFAADDERKTLVRFIDEVSIEEKAKQFAITLLKKGLKKYGDKFKNNILLDLKSVGYLAIDIGLTIPEDIVISDGAPIYCIFVQEEDLNSLTLQHHMSDGMYRAIILIIKLNYILLQDNKSMLLVDDIGEGLDFKRSKSLVELVINKSVSSELQVLLSTNDQFVMNGIPLQYWAIVKRAGNTVSYITQKTSPEAFEKFKFIGLNNFEFFASEFFEEK